MNIAGMNKAVILAKLYDSAQPLGLGFLHFTPEPMTIEQAQKLLDESDDKYFDYVKGRVMKISLASDEMRTDLYNRDNGEGKAESILATIPKSYEKNL